MNELLAQTAPALLTGALSGAIGILMQAVALRVHLKYLRRDVDRAQRTAERAHTRINQILSEG